MTTSIQAELNELNRQLVRGQLLYTPTDTLSVRIIADYSQIDELCCGTGTIFDGPGDTVPPFAGNVIPASQFDDNITNAEADGSAKIEEYGLSAEVNWEIGGGTLTSITAYRTYDADTFAEVDATAAELFTAAIVAEQEAFTQEIRFTNTEGERFSYTVGAYYFTQNLDQRRDFFAGADQNDSSGGGLTGGFAAFPGAFLGDPLALEDALAADAALGFLGHAPGSVSTDISSQDTQNWALFGQSDFAITKKLVLTTGIRYTNERKELEMDFSEFIPGHVIGGSDNPTLVAGISAGQFFDAPNAGLTFIPQNFVLSGFAGFFGLAAKDFSEDLTEEALTSAIRLSYFINSETMAYVGYSTGFKSGGANVARVDVDDNGNPTIPIIFDAETVSSWETGLKTSLFDNKLRINAALFYSVFDDFQQSVFTGNNILLANAGSIVSQGAEIEMFAAPNKYLTLNLGIGYVDAKYDEFESGLCITTPPGIATSALEPGFPFVCDNSGNRVSNSAEWKLNAGLQGDIPVNDDLGLYGRIDFSYVSEQEGAGLPSNDPNGRADSSFLTNLRLGFHYQDNWDVALWATNLFDKDIPASGGFPGRQGQLGAFHTPPRFYGLTLRYIY